MELVFARGTGGGAAPAPAPTPAAPLRAAPDALARADSLEHLRPLSTITDDDPGKYFHKFISHIYQTLSFLDLQGTATVELNLEKGSTE